MDLNKNQLYQIKKEKLKKAFQQNGIECLFVENKQELLDYLKPYLKENKTVGVGGSMTLFETGIIDLLRKSPIQFLDRYQKDLTRDEVEEIFHRSLLADFYFTSSNAIDMQGNLYNIDGNGNRVAAMIYGPKKVFVIVGKNKIVEDEKAAIQYIQNVSAPANAMRLNRKTPCIQTGSCMNCQSADRICSMYTKISRQQQGRMTVLVVNEELGY
ncbi:MAG: lactate utilization protein [Bacillota bacterium]|nr:lactate utilization protein [Bacillota bacterium]